MKISNARFQLALARSQKTIRGIGCGLSSATIAKIRQGKDISPKTVGKIAAALGLDPAELVLVAPERE